MNQGFELSFCSVIACGSQSSSFCQTGPDGSDKNNLGTWAGAVDLHGSAGKFAVRMEDGDIKWCDKPRATNFIFKCVDGPAAIINVTETAACEYACAVEVPRVVCQNWFPCCTPATFGATRMQADGSVAVFQADGARGLWFDQNYQNSGSGILCSPTYNRCFTFTATQCIGTAYRPVPQQCFGADSEWKFVRDTWLTIPSMKQSVWYSGANKTYVVTMPLQSPESCVVVSGNRVDTASEFVTTPNTTFWEIPPSCVKLVK